MYCKGLADYWPSRLSDQALNICHYTLHFFSIIRICVFYLIADKKNQAISWAIEGYSALLNAKWQMNITHCYSNNHCEQTLIKHIFIFKLAVTYFWSSEGSRNKFWTQPCKLLKSASKQFSSTTHPAGFVLTSWMEVQYLVSFSSVLASTNSWGKHLAVKCSIWYDVQHLVVHRVCLPFDAEQGVCSRSLEHFDWK